MLLNALQYRLKRRAHPKDPATSSSGRFYVILERGASAMSGHQYLRRHAIRSSSLIGRSRARRIVSPAVSSGVATVTDRWMAAWAPAPPVISHSATHNRPADAAWDELYVCASPGSSSSVSQSYRWRAVPASGKDATDVAEH